MTKYLESLTEDQIAQAPAFVDELVDLALNVDRPLDKVVFSAAVDKLYDLLREEKQHTGPTPPIVWLPSPYASVIFLSLLAEPALTAELEKAKKRRKDIVLKHTPNYLSNKSFEAAFEAFCRFKGADISKVWSRFEFPRAIKLVWESFTGGYFWASWPSFEMFVTQKCGLKLDKQTQNRLDICEALTFNASWTFWYDLVVVATEKHTSIHRDLEHRLHNTTGPALLWSDGYALHALNGVVVPAAWVEDTANVDPTLALTWPNTEQRRCLRELLGWTKVLAKLDVKVIDTDKDPQVGELIEVSLPSETSGPARFLRVQCATKREFALRIDPKCRTALEAQAWLHGYDDATLFVLPEVRT